MLLTRVDIQPVHQDTEYKFLQESGDERLSCLAVDGSLGEVASPSGDPECVRCGKIFPLGVFSRVFKSLVLFLQGSKNCGSICSISESTLCQE